MINKLSQFIPKKGIEETASQKKTTINEPLPDFILDKPEENKETQTKWHLPNWEQFLFLLKSLSDKEKKIVLGALFIACIALAGWGISMYVVDTDRRPALGGSYTEGVQGQPLYLNPVVAHSNPVDSDLTRLIFSSLFRYDSEGKLEQDLVSNWERSEDGMIYTVRMRNDAKWHDGKPLTAEDVLFTLNLIRNPNFGSTLRGNWEGIEVNKADEYSLQFTLKKPYTPFLHNLTFGVLPKHVWENVTSDKFLLTELNRKPVGSGMYSFIKLNKDKDGKIISLTLRTNRDYYRPQAHIRELTFNFYDTPESILESFKAGEIEGISHIESNQIKEVAGESNLKIYDIPTTRIYGIFFNQKRSLILADKKNREALTFATDKDELLKTALENKGVVVSTPIVPNMLGYDTNLNRYEYDQERARIILKGNGWEKLNEKELKKMKEEGEGKNGLLYNSKTKKFLEITLTVPDYPELVKTADLLKQQWEKIGLRLNLDIVDTSESLQNKINERNYEALLFGEVLQPDPDPTPFWHSSSKQSPGLNLAMFENDEVDGILDSARQEVNVDKRAELYRRFQEIVNQELPALFLFSPYYMYGVSDDYQGVGTKIIYNPSDRLDDINNRYLFTSRTRK